jgi:GDSL-like lipase/acylhydrolase family protein
MAWRVHRVCAMRRVGQIMAVLAILVSAGCLVDTQHDGVFTVACLGDSNTQKDWPTVGTVRWCEMGLASQPTATVWLNRQLVTEPTAIINEGVGGATVCPQAGWSWSFPQFLHAKAHRADIAIAAFGSNDIFGLSKTPDEIVRCYRDLLALAGSLPVFIALVPPALPLGGDGDLRIRAVNDALRAAFPSHILMDFYAGFTEEDFSDVVHFNIQSGQAKRAAIALAFLEGK